MLVPFFSRRAQGQTDPWGLGGGLGYIKTCSNTNTKIKTKAKASTIAKTRRSRLPCSTLCLDAYRASADFLCCRQSWMASAGDKLDALSFALQMCQYALHRVQCQR